MLGLGIGIDKGRGLPLVKKRNNTVGVAVVDKEIYDTNNSSTKYTVGNNGANYTSLILAYGASVAGDVIELLDDEHTLSGQLFMTKGKDTNGKSVKIKGKTTKTTLILANITYPVALVTANASIEFENIIFKQVDNNVPFRNETNAISGHARFINCSFDGGKHLEIINCSEFVLDGVNFINQISTQVISLSHTNATANYKTICNNILCNYNSINYFILYSKTQGVIVNSLSITNSDIYINRNLTFGVNANINNINISGNKIGCLIGAGIGKLGVEATGSNIEDYIAYNAGTTYNIGDKVEYLSNLWQAIQSTTGNAPSKTSLYWKVAEITTGKIENNLIYKTNYVLDGHGLFIGFGCYNFTIKNNIVTNYWYNIVVKGVNNIIQYNCAGRGFRGISIFANNQNIVSNNTSRSEDDYGLQLNVQSVGGTSVENTIVRDNILTTLPDNDYVVLISNTLNNSYTQNILWGEAVKVYFQDIVYDLNLVLDVEALKLAMGDTKLKVLNPEYLGTNDLFEDYYKPTNKKFNYIRDSYGQCVGAVDIRK